MKLTKIVIAAALILSSAALTKAESTVSKAHLNSHKELMAARAKKQNKLIDQSAFIDLNSDIAPELDIFTEGWNSRSVNPFKESEVPNKDVIDVTGYCMPVPGKITSNYGYRAKFGRMHKGVDLALRSNDTVYAAFDGKVRITNYEAKGYGNYVVMRHPNKLETVYGHLNKILVKQDQMVKAGDPIGLGGSTGRSTGPHLHFETRYMGYAINPSAIFDFNNNTTHADTYTFTKQTYQNARNFTPATEPKSETAPLQASAAGDENTYIVRSGDTIASIADFSGITKTRLLQLNGLSANSQLKAGQVLKVK